MKFRKRGFSLLLVAALCIGTIPTVSLAAGSEQTAGQIGNHFEVSDTTGALPSEPQMTGDTSKSYADDWVRTDKTIKAGDQENEFIITLEVQTKASMERAVISEDAATVIVIDLSGSMAGSRLTSAKQAALAFVSDFSITTGDDVSRKIAVVGFSGYPERNITAAITYQGWTDASDAGITTAINSMTAQGGTCLQAGLILAKNLLNSGEVADIPNKNIIVLTDGNPTYYLSDAAAASTSTTSIGAPDQIRGTGSSTTHATHEKTEETAQTIAAMEGVSVYAIYLGSDRVQCTDGGESCDLTRKRGQREYGVTGEEWLRSYCDFITYAASNVSDLSQLFLDISSLIKVEAEAWRAADPLTDMVDFTGFVSTHHVDANEFWYNDDSDTVHWNLRLCEPVEKTADGYSVYQLQYTIKLNTLVDGFTAGTYYATNGVTAVTYLIRQTGNEEENLTYGTAYFNVPSVQGYVADLSFQKTDEKGDPLPGAAFGLYHGTQLIAEAVSNANGLVIFEGIPSGHTYMIVETEAPEGYTANTGEYEIIVSYGELTGALQTGSTVVNTPVNPGQTDPEPEVPEPANPEPADPEPADPEPADPEPADPEPTDPEPTDPEPADPEPVDPEPADLEPVDPEPVDPEPMDPEPSPEYGSLTVSKTVSGGGASTTKQFTFTVTLSDRTINGEYDDMTFQDGVAEFTLAHNESKTAASLPVGIGYTVIESDNSGYTVTVNGTSSTTASGVIQADSPSAEAFDNYRFGGDAASPDPTGSVEITKTVTGEQAPSERIEYEFRLWVRTSGGTAVTESTAYRLAGSDGSVKTGRVTIGADGYMFILKDGESITFTDITSGRRVEVQEITTGDFTTTTSGLTDSVCVISSNGTKSVEFVNTYGNDAASTDSSDTADRDDPTIPDDPAIPSAPDSQNTPETPSTPEAPNTPDRSIDDVPKTGGSINLRLYIALACLSLFGLIAAVWGKKRLSPLG